MFFLSNFFFFAIKTKRKEKKTESTQFIWFIEKAHMQSSLFLNNLCLKINFFYLLFVYPIIGV